MRRILSSIAIVTLLATQTTSLAQEETPPVPAPVQGEIQHVRGVFLTWESEEPLTQPRQVRVQGASFAGYRESPDSAAPTSGAIIVMYANACWDAVLISGTFHKEWHEYHDCPLHTYYFPSIGMTINVQEE